MSWQNLTNEQLEALPTHRLLEVFKIARSAYYSSNTCTCWGCANCNCGSDTDGGQKRVDFIKSILDERGHVGDEDKVNNKTRDPKLNGERFGYTKSQLRRIELYSPKPAEPRTGPISNPEEAVGRQVFKTSKKPFKSKQVYNTVSGVTINPHTKRTAFTFVEDESIVDAHICQLRKT